MLRQLAGHLSILAMLCLVLGIADLLLVVRQGAWLVPNTATALYLLLSSVFLRAMVYTLVLAAFGPLLVLLARRTGPWTGALLAGLPLAILGGVLSGLEVGHKPHFVAGMAVVGYAVGSASWRVGLADIKRRSTLVLLSAFLAAGSTLFLADALLFPDQYFRLHLNLAFLASVCLFVALDGLIRRGGHLSLVRWVRVGAVGVTVVAVLAFSLFQGSLGGDAVRHVARTNLASLGETTRLMSRISDYDGDGYSALLGELDCAPTDASIHPGAVEIPGDGLDQNCLGGDPGPADRDAFMRRFRLRTSAWPTPLDNLVLISVDALRTDRFFGPEAPKELRRLSTRSLSFRRAYCLFPSTLASLTGLFTSQYPSCIHYTRWEKWEDRAFPSAGEDTGTNLFEVLAAHGFRSSAQVYHALLGAETGVSRGVEDIWCPASTGDEISTAETTTRALEFLDSVGSERFALWVHFYDPHLEWICADGSSGLGFEFRCYDEEVARAAQGVDQVLQRLQERGLLESTAVVFFSDHGEELEDHGGIAHGKTLYEESLRVPLAFILPGMEAGVIEGPVSLIDLAPTILDLLGLGGEQPDDWVGESFAGLLSGNEDDSQRLIFGELVPWRRPMHMYSVLEWPWKLLYFSHSHTHQLFHLEDDPGEHQNLADQEPEVAAKLSRLLDQHMAFHLGSCRD